MNEVKNEIKNEIKNETKNVNTEQVADIFESWRERDELGSSTEGSTKTFKTKILVQHYSSTRNGTTYDNYGFAVKTTVAGNEITQVVMISPADSRKVLYDTLSVIMKTGDKHYLEITKTGIRDNSTGIVNYIYGMQISCLADNGTEFICAMKPSGRADKVVFENIKRQLIAEGIIE